MLDSHNKYRFLIHVHLRECLENAQREVQWDFYLNMSDFTMRKVSEGLNIGYCMKLNVSSQK
jgi:hypothetical protein